jgi:hypothetical protein
MLAPYDPLSAASNNALSLVSIYAHRLTLILSYRYGREHVYGGCDSERWPHGEGT